LIRLKCGIVTSTSRDCHVHLAGLGDGGSGIEIGPQLSSLRHPLRYAQRLFYLNASCARHAPGQVDAAYAARLLNLCDAMPAGFKVLLFAFERFHDENGRPEIERTSFYIPNAWAARLAREFPARFAWAASVHPYRADAVASLSRRCGRCLARQLGGWGASGQMAAGGDGHGPRIRALRGFLSSLGRAARSPDRSLRG